MKLVYVADNGFSSNEGINYYSTPNYIHVSYMKKYFEEIVFFARRDKYDDSNRPIDNKYPVYLFEKYDFLNMSKKMIEQIKEADIVIVYGINGYIAQFIARTMGKKVIAYIGGDSKEALLITKNIKKILIAPIIGELDKWKCSTADYVHYCAEFLYKKYPTRNERLICSGANIVIDNNCLKKRYNRISKELFVLGLIGYTHNNIKGIDTAIRAVALVKKALNVELQIVGRGDTSFLMRLATELGVENNVKFLGTKKAGDEIYSWLDNVDIYLQPSRSEGLPRATVEAMSRGCPVIASDVGALPELIDNEYIIKRDDYQKLACIIEKLVHDSIEMEKQSYRNFERAKEFKPEIREKKYDAFYEKIRQEA